MKTSDLVVGDEDKDECYIIDNRWVFIPRFHSHVQQVIWCLLDLLTLVERHQCLHNLFILQKLKDTVWANHDHAVLIAEAEFCIEGQLHLISGMGLTPTDAPTKSPKLRVIARPGTLSFCTQTLRGPIGSPYSSLKASTLPFILRMRSASFSRVGLWSVDSGMASHLLFLKRPRMALLSPTFAQSSLFCWR